MWYFGIILLATTVVAFKDSSEYDVPAPKGTNCSCGWTNPSRARIIGGQETGVNEFPMMVGFILRRLFIPGIVDMKNVHFCGGTLITRRHVITAGHCLHDQNGKRLTEKDMGIVLGAHNLKKLDYNNPKVMIKPEKLILHPKYQWQAHFDVGMVVVPHKVEFSRIIGPACLPVERFEVAAKELTVIGWGFISPQGPSSNVLKKTKVIGMSHRSCSRIWGIMPPFSTVERYQFCTFQPGTSQCLGDSGGPIMWVNPVTKRWTLVAAVSYGTSTCHTHPCVSSDISYFMPWIQKTIAETYPEEKTCAHI
uniref:Venom S1 protease 13 n=1 Tax=Ectomocoris sp. TaxID=3104572 RepID=A0AB38ZE90_9HEMI